MAIKKALALYGGEFEELRSGDSFSVPWGWLTSLPTTLAGYGITDAQPLDSDLTALSGLSTTGLVARISAGSVAARSIAGTANQISVANGDGVSANPTISLPSAITMPGTLTLNADPTLSLHAATKQYVDGLAANLGKRARARAATTANITIASALNNSDTLDGVTLATGDLVLVKNQTSPAQNGLYVVGVSPARAFDFDTYNEHPGSLISVAEGTVNADTLWLCTSNDGGTLDTTTIAFSKMIIAGELLATNNLSDLQDANAARSALGLAIGSNVQAFDSDLSAVAGLSTTGIVARTGAGTATTRAITGTANQITVANGDGISGNPTLSLPADVVIPTIVTAPNTGLHVLDTDASHDLILEPGSNLTADRTLTLTTGDADSTLDVANVRTASITFIIDDGGSVIATGIKGDLEIPFGCTIQAVTLLADQTGSIVIDIWKDSYAAYPPTVADSITASAKPTLSSALKSQDTSLTGWTTSSSAGQILRFNVSSASAVTRVTLSLKVLKN